MADLAISKGNDGAYPKIQLGTNRKWRAKRDETVNTYVIAIAV
jgi:hypothetical protein